MFIIANLKTMFYEYLVVIFAPYLHTKFLMASSSDSLIIAVEQKA
jgi:hypothetical protein